MPSRRPGGKPCGASSQRWLEDAAVTETPFFVADALLGLTTREAEAVLQALERTVAACGTNPTSPANSAHAGLCGLLRDVADRLRPHVPSACALESAARVPSLASAEPAPAVIAANPSTSMNWMVCADGACAPTNPGPSGWGAVLIDLDRGIETDHYGFIGHGTNQVAELMAGIEGLSRTPVGAKVELVSDSQYVLKGLTEWRAGWERNGFRNAKKEPVANQALWIRLFAAADARRVTTRWVKGHNGHAHNERADELANRSLKFRAGSAN